MWIRSQDKETLTDVKHVSIRCLCGRYNIFTDNHLAPNEICNLATYKTKEKALKVLDMIQERICGINGILKLNGLYNDKERENIKKRVDEKVKNGTFMPDSHFTHIQTSLFSQMPQDDEV